MQERSTGDPTANIPVDAFVNRFNVENPQVVEILHRFPALCYLLGTSEIQTVFDVDKNAQITIPILRDGSAMFGLSRPEDVMKWKGIDNHIFGSKRQVHFLTPRILDMNDHQRSIFAQAGFDLTTLNNLNPRVEETVITVSHAGRRLADEHKWYTIQGNRVHNAPEEDPQNKDLNFHSYFYTMRTLREFEADPTFVEMMRVEGHDYLVENARANSGINPDFFDNIYDYCDWTFNQQPVPLATRFEGLRASGRQTPEILDILQNAGTKFEETLKMALGNDIFEQMASAPPFPGEVEIRAAYAASAGLTLNHVYPEFAARYA